MNTLSVTTRNMFKSSFSSLCRCFERRPQLSQDPVAFPRNVPSLPLGEGQRGSQVEQRAGPSLPPVLLFSRAYRHRYSFFAQELINVGILQKCVSSFCLLVSTLFSSIRMKPTSVFFQIFLSIDLPRVQMILILFFAMVTDVLFQQVKH